MKVKLGEYIRIMHGFAFKTENYVDYSEYRLVTLGNFQEGGNCFKYNDSKATYYGAEFPEKFILKSGDLIMPLTEQVIGLFGNSALVPEEIRFKFVLNQRVGKVEIIRDGIDLYYLHYLLATTSVKNQLEARASGTKQRNISPDDVYDVTIDLPDYSIQKRIGKLLHNIEMKQEINNKISTELESISRALYDYWFLQFEFPNEVGKPYKSSGGKMIWNEELKREIPEGWRVENLKDITALSLGGTPSRDKKEYWGNGTINWLNSGEISNFPIITSEEKITRLGLENSATEYMKKGTVVISITGNIRASILGIDSCANQSVVGISESGIYKKEYLYPAISMLLDQFTKISTGNCQQHINKKTLEESKTLIPPDSILQNYYLQVKPLYSAILNNTFQNQELSSLRDFLLPMLMNGQVTFKS